MLPIDDAIRTRKTVKMLAEPAQPLPAKTDIRPVLDEVIALAGWAPFHKACDRSHRADTGVVEPWRFYMLDAPACRRLIPLVEKAEKPGNIPAMLAGADALIQVTWLPNPPADPPAGAAAADLFEPTRDNQEHIAAASSAIQTLLLAATARGLTTYWSSGGCLRSDAVFAALGIPQEQILLGSVFFFPADYETQTWKPGGLRPHRNDPGAWSCWVDPAVA